MLALKREGYASWYADLFLEIEGRFVFTAGPKYLSNELFCESLKLAFEVDDFLDSDELEL